MLGACVDATEDNRYMPTAIPGMIEPDEATSAAARDRGGLSDRCPILPGSALVDR